MNKRWIDFVKRSHCGEIRITTNTRLCRIDFTPDSFTNYHQVQLEFIDSRLVLVSGTKPALSLPDFHPPGLHPPDAPTAGAGIATDIATVSGGDYVGLCGIMCP